MRACAVETHVNISQADQNEPRTRTHILCEPAQSKRMSRFYKSHINAEIYRKNAAPQNEPRMRTHFFVRACAVETHVKISQEPFYAELTGKMPRPGMSPERGHTFCANLRSQNACQDFTRATLCGNLPEKCRTPE